MRKSLFLLVIVFIAFPLFSSARSGCCSWHGGVSSCDTSTGHQVCNDGSYSPSCTCQYIPKKTIVKNVSKTISFPNNIKSYADITVLDNGGLMLQFGWDAFPFKVDDYEAILENQDGTKDTELSSTFENRNFVVFSPFSGEQSTFYIHLRGKLPNGQWTEVGDYKYITPTIHPLPAKDCSATPVVSTSQNSDYSGWAGLATLAAVIFGISLIVTVHNKKETEQELNRLKYPNSQYPQSP